LCYGTILWEGIWGIIKILCIKIWHYSVRGTVESINIFSIEI
jgi:hypothetical protein